VEVGTLKSRYLDRFKKWNDMSGLELAGDQLIVEAIETEVKTASGIIVATPKDHVQKNFTVAKPIWVRILYTGKGYYDPESGKDIPLDTKAGDICMVSPSSVVWLSAFGGMMDLVPETLGMSKETEIKLRFRGDDVFQEAYRILNGTP